MNSHILRKPARKKRANSTSGSTQIRSGPGIVVSVVNRQRFFAATANGAAALEKWLTRRAKRCIHIRWLLLSEWPQEFRWLAFQAIAKVKDKRILVGRRGSTKHKSCFDAVLAAIRPHCGVPDLATLKGAAYEAAALEFPIGALDDVISQLFKRIKDIGYDPPDKKKILTATTNVARYLQGIPSVDPQLTAELFLKQFTGPHTGDDHLVPRLAWYRQEWYFFDHTGWKCQSEAELEGKLVNWLQEKGRGQVKITKRFTSDILHNLIGLCNQFPSAMEEPLWIEDGGKVIRSPYIAAQNCLLDMQPVLEGSDAPTIRQLTPRHFSRVRLAVPYDQSAKSRRFAKALRQIFKPQQEGDRRIDVFQEFAGWLLDGGSLRLERFLVLYGKGSNGKSVLLTLLRDILGSNNVSSIPLQQLNHDFMLSDIVGKLANIANEMPRVELFEEGTLKQLVSGDPVQINRKYKDPLTVTPRTKLLFGTNFLPPVADRSEAYFRRVIAMPLFEVFEGDANDIGLLATLRGELPGILNWMITGLARLARNKRFTHCSVCEAARENYKLASDPIRQFIDECCVLQKGAIVTIQSAYERYGRWCEEAGRKKMNRSTFAQGMEKQGIRQRRPGPRKASHRPRVFEGVDLRTSHSDF